TLVNGIKSGRIAHAFLFTGVRGVGKTSAARILAKCLNCLQSEGPTVKPCLRCSSCTAVHQGEDIDVIEIDGASNNSVDDMRDLRQNAAYRPNRSRFKIYIIDEVHMLSNSAFNALLKILEEPPGHVKFIFATTEPQKIPATILSRCQRYDFRTIGQADIAAHLKKILKGEKIAAEPEALAQIARLAAGSMRDGLSILDQLLSVNQKKLTSKQVEQTLGMPHFGQVLELVGALVANDVRAALDGLDKLVELGHSLEQIVSAVIEHCRNLMLLQACGAKTELVAAGGDNRQGLIEQSALVDVPTIVFFISVLEELSRAMRFSSSARALCEAGLVRLAGREKFVSTEAMIGLLESGQSGAGSTDRVKQSGRGSTGETKTKSATGSSAKAGKAGPGGPSRKRVSKEAVEASKRNPLVSKTVELFNGIIMNVNEDPPDPSGLDYG
ncbi:MAG: DNA polymerase III subunit gamma/tau, partial [Phycisphaerae bacterium]|nr:DNA polymerase III subunit gamma/tau [Phycisphaerae bacterium]